MGRVVREKRRPPRARRGGGDQCPHHPQGRGRARHRGAIAALKPKSSVRPARIRLERQRLDESSLDTIFEIVANNPGKRPLVLEFVMPGGRCIELAAGDNFRVADERTLAAALAGFSPAA